MIANLKRLAGAKEVTLDDFSNGKGVFLVTYQAPPVLRMADVKAQAGNYAIESVSLKLTGKVTQKKEQYYLGPVELVKGTDEAVYTKLVDLVKEKKTMLVVSGLLKEDDKTRAQSLALTSVGEIDKKK